MKNKFLAIILILFVVKSKAQNVGIGTPTPTATLEVKNSGKSVLMISSKDYLDSTHLIFSNRFNGVTGTDMILSHNQEIGLKFSSKSDLASRNVDNILIITPNGRVGIRNNSPLYPLDLNGDMNLTGNLWIGGSKGNSGDLLSIKSNGAMEWKKPGSSVTDTVIILPFNLSSNNSNYVFKFNSTLQYGYPGNSPSANLLEFFAPINLPGANVAIKELQVHFIDNNGLENLFLYFYRTPLNSISSTDTEIITGLYTNLINTTAIQTQTWTPATPYPIINSSNGYYIKLFTLNRSWPGDTSIGFKALRIIYTHTN